MSAIPLSSLATTGSWQADFQAVLPVIASHARLKFRALPTERREEAIQEAIAAGCVNYRKLVDAGRLHVAYPSSMADQAVALFTSDADLPVIPVI